MLKHHWICQEGCKKDFKDPGLKNYNDRDRAVLSAYSPGAGDKSRRIHKVSSNFIIRPSQLPTGLHYFTIRLHYGGVLPYLTAIKSAGWRSLLPSQPQHPFATQMRTRMWQHGLARMTLPSLASPSTCAHRSWHTGRRLSQV